MGGRQGKESWSALVLVLGLAGLVVMADNWVVSPLLPSIAGALDAPVERTGVLIAAYMLPFGLFQLLFGPVADRFGKFRTIAFTLAVFSVVTAIGGFMTSLTGLVAVRAVTGIFAASTMPVSLALIGDVVPIQQRQRAIGTFMGIAFLGQGLSMAVGGTIAAVFSWRGVFFVYGLLGALVVAILLTKGRRFAVRPTAAPGPLFAPYRALLGRWTSLRVYLIALGEGMLILGLFSYLGALLHERHGLGPLGVGLSLTAFGLASVIFGRVSGRLATRVGRANLIGLALLLGGVSALVLFLASSLALAIVVIFALGASFMLAHSSVLTIATELAAQHRGVAMSLVAFAFMGGGSVGTMLAGRVIAARSFEAYLVVWGLGLVVLAGVSSLILSRGTEEQRGGAVGTAGLRTVPAEAAPESS